MTAQLDIYSFGRELLRTKDLDPVYVLVHGAKMEEEEKLRKWLLAYWCFYHVGTASAIADSDEYWETMLAAAGSKDWPRSSERRHFRGDNGKNSVAYLARRGLPSLFAPFDGRPLSYAAVEGHVTTWEGFGPWIAFKVADMLERLAISPVDFSRAKLFDSPMKAAEMLWAEEQPDVPQPPGVIDWAVRRILFKVHSQMAPPRYERPLNVQEAETILCKWLSYRNGHYHVGEDIAACRKGLARFPRSATAQRLYRAGKEAALWA